MDAQTIGIAVSIALAVAGFFIGVIRWLIESQKKHYEELLTEQNKKLAGLYDAVNTLKVELAKDFLRRSDCQSCQEHKLRDLVQIENKLDALRDRMLEKLDQKIDALRRDFQDGLRHVMRVPGRGQEGGTADA